MFIPIASNDTHPRILGSSASLVSRLAINRVATCPNPSCGGLPAFRKQQTRMALCFYGREQPSRPQQPKTPSGPDNFGRDLRNRFRALELDPVSLQPYIGLQLVRYRPAKNDFIGHARLGIAGAVCVYGPIPRRSRDAAAGGVGDSFLLLVDFGVRAAPQTKRATPVQGVALSRCAN